MTEESSDVIRRDKYAAGPARGFLSSIDSDNRIFDADLAVDRAHVVMLTEQHIIDAADATAILSALDTIETAGYDALPTGEDVHAAIETAVINEIGERGGRMHTARSRNDEVSACIRYRLRQDLNTLLSSLIQFREICLDSANEHIETAMPGFTHLQPAQPITAAHWLLSYEQALQRDTSRLLDTYARVNQSPLGAAAFAGTPFPIDRERTAELLGFDSVITNSIDAVTGRDFLLETANAITIIATTLSGLAEDLIIFSNKNFVELADEFASTSSIMPQKKNPDTMELVRATTGDAVATYTGLSTALKGLPRAYNRDLQRVTTFIWGGVDAVTDALDVSTGAISTLEWNEAALHAAADDGFSTATGVADQLAMAGIPFRTAHEIVADVPENEQNYAGIDRIVRKKTGQALDEFVDEETINQALDPMENIAMRDSVGGPAVGPVLEAIETAQATVETHRTTISDARAELDGASNQLETEVNEYLT